MTAEEPELRTLLSQLRCLEGRQFTFTGLSGGLTNRNLVVTAGADRFVVRVSQPGAGLLSINRDHEHHNSVVAAESGVGAGVIEYRPDLRVLVVEYVEARTCSKADLADPTVLRRAVEACRRLHGGRRFGNDFDMFDLQAGYLSTVQSLGFRLPDRYLDFLPDVDRIKAALLASDEGTRPCHNDLLAENCLDDGHSVRLIDYEYSGNNDPCFELGNLWSESTLSLEHLDEIVTCYFGGYSAQKVARARLQGLMSKYGWMLWASIQEATAPLDFDFWSWGLEKYERALVEFTSARFDGLLDEAARG